MIAEAWQKHCTKREADVESQPDAAEAIRDAIRAVMLSEKRIKEMAQAKTPANSLESVVLQEEISLFAEGKQPSRYIHHIKELFEMARLYEKDAEINGSSVFYGPSEKELGERGISAEKEVEIYGVKAERHILAEYDAEEDKTTYHIFYSPPIEDYFDKRNEEIRDTANLVPFKRLIIGKFPGLYGWTILTDNVMGLDEGLQSGDQEFKKMVYVHEAIHTPDEFETRMITDWIMSKEMPMSYRIAGLKKFM
jgi:hypothetical protein